MLEGEVKLREIVKLIGTCWKEAEAATIAAVAEKYFDPPEEVITFLFSRELHAVVARKSGERLFERAFLSDFERDLEERGLEFLSSTQYRLNGLVARVNLHSRYHEGRRSAADVGIVIRRPTLYFHHGPMHYELRLDRGQALLAQAKLGRFSSTRKRSWKWGRLTGLQARLREDHLAYYSLLLYRLDNTAVSPLSHFSWQPCAGRTVAELKTWLRAGTFPAEVPSEDLIQKLADAEIGTSSQELIESIVDPSPSQARVIEIHIFWKQGDGNPPPGPIYVGLKNRQEVNQRVPVFVGL